MKIIIKNITFVFIFIFFIVIIFSNTFLHILDAFDELWTFQITYKMYNSHQIYIDSNIVTTPLFFVIGNTLFNIFGATINTFRLYNVFIYIFCYLSTIYLFKKLGINKSLIFLYSTLIVSQTYYTIANGASYNLLAIDFILLGIIIFLNYYNTKRYNLYQGIVLFLVFFTKQNLGIFYAMGIILFELFDKKLSKSFILNQLEKFLSFVLPTILSCIIMYKQGNLFSFINYAFGSLLEFGTSNANSDYKLFIFIYILLIIIELYCFIIKTKNLVSENQKRIISFFFIVGICTSLFIFPIVNLYHVTFGYFILFLTFFYILDIIFLKHIFYTESHYKLCNFISIIILLLISLSILSQTYINFNEFNKFDKSHPFYNAPFEEETIERINTVTEYVLEKNKNGINVTIIASDSAYTMIPLRQSHGAFDMVLTGNLGYNGANKLIKQIENSKNTEFLIYTAEDKVFWADSKEIREYITNKLEKKGEIAHYSIYSK